VPGPARHLRTRVGTVTVGDVPPDSLERLLAGDPLLVEELGTEPARRLVEAGLVVAG
jgi:hypothetical protein